MFDEFIDGMAQLGNTGEVGSLQGLAAQDAKPNLDLIEPRGVGGAANKRDIPYQSLIKVWLSERVSKREERA